MATPKTPLDPLSEANGKAAWLDWRDAPSHKSGGGAFDVELGQDDSLQIILEWPAGPR